MTARFIAFEGGEASGKSTQAARLADELGALRTHEPGGTTIGGAVRALLLDASTERLDPRAEALLMLADRAQHVAEVVEPALRSGRHVVTDRFSGSTLAYQGHARGLGIEELAPLCDWASAGRWPDLVLLLEVPVAASRQRLGDARDRLESESDDFHEAVAAGFRIQAAADPARWAVIDGTAAVDDVAAAVRAAVRDRLGC